MIGRQRHAALVYRVLLRIYDIMSWSTDTCQIKLSADPYHVTISRAQVYSSSRHVFYWNWPLTKCWFLIGSQARVRLTCWKQRWVLRKPVNSNPGLKANQIYTSVFVYSFRFVYQFCDYASINVKPEGGDPGHMWGIWLFRKFYGQNPHYGAPKLGKIRSNIPRCSINLYWKWVVRSSVFVQRSVWTSVFLY